jgi:rhodanese-related sulfurtransferase
VLLDDGDGVAEKAARRLAGMGYRNLAVLEGGAPGWAAAGYTLFKGVNVPSKTFGEMVEHECRTPNLSAEKLKAMQEKGDDFILLDGRPIHEYCCFTIPGSTCCPNAELGHRLPLLLEDEDTPIVVNCAGRTRSIMGAQNLREMGFKNPIFALRNGTQGWLLAGYELEYGSERFYPEVVSGTAMAQSRARAAHLRARHDIPLVDAATLESWRADPDRTLYLLDVRTAAEYEAGHLPGAQHAPGGQAVQATDQWVAVRGARIVLCDDTGLRAGITAHWLRGMGHEAYVLDEDVSKLTDTETGTPEAALATDPLPEITPVELAAGLQSGALTLLDVNVGMAYRDGHIDGARWACRPRLGRLGLAPGTPVVLTAKDRRRAQLAALDLAELGIGPVRYLAGGRAEWEAAGLKIVESPNDPSEADCIDYLFFVHDRQNNLDHARGYLAWEVGLMDQMDEQEKGVFRL